MEQWTSFMNFLFKYKRKQTVCYAKMTVVDGKFYSALCLPTQWRRAQPNMTSTPTGF